MISKLTFRIGGLIASLALFLGIASSQAACASWYHQPKIPHAMERFKK